MPHVPAKQMGGPEYERIAILKEWSRYNARWTKKEIECLRAAWPNRSALEKLLPGRSYTSCKSKAYTLGIHGSFFNWNSTAILRLRRLYPKSSWEDLSEAFPGATKAAIRNAAHLHKIKRPRPSLMSTGNNIIDEIRREAISQRWTMYDLDDATGGPPYFACLHKLKKFRTDRVLRALDLLGGRLVIDWTVRDEVISPQD